SGGSNWHYGSSNSGTTSCNTEACRRNAIIIGSVIGGIFGLVFLCICCLICIKICKPGFYSSICPCEYSKKAPYQLKKTSIRSNTLPYAIKLSTVDTTFPSTSRITLPSISHTKLPPILYSKTSTGKVFQSGSYDMRYYQYGKWHGPFLVQLEFINRNVQGSGNDDVGSFDVTGHYSRSDYHMNLTKQYKLGTGNPRENLGHQVKIDLKWNEHAKHFDGQWIVKTANYSGQDKFELKLRPYV
ncbi:unnamed protein product, partial [Rotaria sp. Silwood2]